MSSNLTWKVPQNAAEVLDYVDIYDRNVVICFILAPWLYIYYNAIARLDYNTRVFTNFFGSGKMACFLWSLTQVVTSKTRDWFFREATLSQEQWVTPHDITLEYIGYALLCVGWFLVVTSFYQLGWFGTFHGDHFGMLLEERVTAFPFNIMDNPMYDGAILNFIGMSLVNRSITGIFLTLWIKVVYVVTVDFFEGPFTAMIYANKAAADKKKTKKGL